MQHACGEKGEICERGRRKRAEEGANGPAGVDVCEQLMNSVRVEREQVDGVGWLAVTDPLSYRVEVMTFRVDVVRSPDPEGDGGPEDVISELLELLQPVHSLKHLRFLGFYNLRWDPTDVRIASIETLTLHEDIHEANRPYEPAPAHPHPHPLLFLSQPSLPLSPYYYQTFLDFLSIFPNLRTLNLSGYAPLENKADEMTPIHPSGTSTFLKRHPHLDLLLKGLKDSKVVEFFYRTDFESERELRLRREGPRKEWEGEWWNL
uniref:Uncharacterized protein n=2 Tax=Rhodotorula toruloides TaxID=5286 RepID=A0A0K3CJQ3_RHOTO